MAGHRIDRINEEVKRELSSILREMKDPRIPELISVTAAQVTPDLKYCKVYVSLFGAKDAKESIKALNKGAGFVRKELAARVNLRSSPQISFVVDNSMEQGAKIIKILDSLDIKDEENDSTSEELE